MCMIICRAVQSSDVSLKIIYCRVYYADIISTQNKHNNSNILWFLGKLFRSICTLNPSE